MRIYHDIRRPRDGRYEFHAYENGRVWTWLKDEPWEPFSEAEVRDLIGKARAAFDAAEASH